MKGLLSGEHDLAAMPREDGWNHLLDRICQREAKQIDPVAIDPNAVREFVERLATLCRNTTSGRGPIGLADIRETFENVFSMPADEKAETLIFRMPGFTAASGQEDAREFIDDDYADACRAGDVIRFIEAPDDIRQDKLLLSAIEMDDLGSSMAAMNAKNLSAKQISAALDKSVEKDAPYVAYDLVGILQRLDLEYVGYGAYINDAIFRTFILTRLPDLGHVNFEGCLFGSVEIVDDSATSPMFINCHVDKLYGAIGITDLPPALKKSAPGIESFVDEAQTNSDILSLPISLSLRVLMIILRKLFIQPGSGRRENALYRGMDSRARPYVSEILEVISQLGFAHSHRTGGPVVWRPNRSHQKRVQDILRAPQQSSDPLVKRAKAL